MPHPRASLAPAADPAAGQPAAPPGGGAAPSAVSHGTSQAVTPASSGVRTRRLTGDGALVIVVDEEVRDLVKAWLPHHLLRWRQEVSNPPTAEACIHVRGTGALGRAAPVHDVTAVAGGEIATFGPVAVHCVPCGLALGVGDGGVRGSIDLVALRAEVEIVTTRRGTGDAVRAMMTVAAATLLGRLGRALVHAAAVVAPDGGAWLLVGDARAGKSTTCATLLEAGWRYTSDDHVVIGPGTGGRLHVEGWPRTLHLDRGWESGSPAGGDRASVDAFEQWPGAWQPSAPVRGAILPCVAADAPTRLLDCSAAARLAALVRQSPWVFADRSAAPAALSLLRQLALLPGAALSLGRDSFRNPSRLEAVLAPLTRARATPATRRRRAAFGDDVEAFP